MRQSGTGNKRLRTVVRLCCGIVNRRFRAFIPGRAEPLFTGAPKSWSRFPGLLLFLLPVLLAGLAGCTPRSGASPERGPVTLEFWDFPHLPRTMAHIKKTIADFEAENPGVKVRYTKLPWQDGQQKVILAVNAGRPPDVCGQVNVSPQFIAQEVLEPVDAWIAPLRDDFHPSYLESVTYRDQVWAFPWYKACYVMLLNLDVFERCGVEPPREGRWTWDEFVEKMKALTAERDKDWKPVAPAGPRGARTPAPVRTYGLITNLGPAEYEAYSLVFGTGGRILQRRPDGTVESTVDEPPFVEGLRRLQDLDFKHGVCYSGTGATTQEQSWNAWRDTGVIGTTIQGAWCLSALRLHNERVEKSNAEKRAAGRGGEQTRPVRWAVAAPPSSDAGTSPVLASSGLGTYVIFKQHDPRKRELAARFILKLITGEGQTVLKEENVYPSLRSTGNLWADDPMLNHVFALFPEGVTHLLVPGGERVDRVLQNEVQRALLRGSNGAPQKTVEEVVRTADIKLNAILERARRRFESSPK